MWVFVPLSAEAQQRGDGTDLEPAIVFSLAADMDAACKLLREAGFLESGGRFGCLPILGPRDPSILLVRCPEIDTRALTIASPATTVAQLAEFTFSDVRRRWGSGHKTMARLEAVLRRFGLTWADTQLIGYDLGRPTVAQIRAAHRSSFNSEGT